jgi:hypothetical protein
MSDVIPPHLRIIRDTRVGSVLMHQQYVFLHRFSPFAFSTLPDTRQTSTWRDQRMGRVR